MKKLMIIGQLPPPFHGSNVMADVMKKSLQKKYDIRFIDKLFGKSIDTIGKITFKKIIRVPILLIEIIFFSLRFKPDLCIFFIAVGKTALSVDILILLILRILKIPYLIRFGGKGYKQYNDENSFWKFALYKSVSKARGAIVLSDRMKTDIDHFISRNKMIPVPNGIEYKKNLPKKDNCGIIQVLYLANLVPSKGPLELVKAAKIVLKSNNNVKFILAGADSSNNFSKVIKNYIKENDLDNSIKLVGKVVGKQKDDLYATSDIFVFPTYFRYEVFANVNVEAMSWGLPIISSNEGAIPDIVDNKLNGFIVNPKSPSEIADKINILVNDASLRKQMGKNGREKFLKNYTIESHSDKLDEAIKLFLKPDF